MMSSNIKIVEMSEKEFVPLWRPLYKKVFIDEPEFDPSDHMSDKAKKNLKDLQKIRNHMDKLFLVAKDGVDIVGWTWGFQGHNDEFYMCNSGVLPDFRKKGIYTALLTETVRKLQDRGYCAIYSRHLAGNNGILIPKLKFGFNITSLEIDVRYGAMVTVKYFFTPEANEVYKLRTGSASYNEKNLKLFE